jgi:hypothetical protein
MVYQRLNKLKALQIGYLLKQNAHDPAIHVRWTLNLHSTSGTQVAPRLELEWCGSYTQRTSNHDTDPVSGVNK